MEYVDDTTEVVSPPRREGLHQTVGIVGDGIWNGVIQSLIDVGFDEGSVPVREDDRAVSKAAFKAWMTAHMADATRKCDAYKARPGFKVNPPGRKCWSARP